VERHLEECPACRSVCGELQALHDLVAELLAFEEGEAKKHRYIGYSELIVMAADCKNIDIFIVVSVN
jgi:predicted anti-sigma-YlaC factor YlaD